MKKYYHFLLFFITFIVGIAFLNTENISADTGKNLYLDSRMQKMYTSEDGLPTTATNAIAQTRDGFMWFGGYGGLARYDGKKFRTYGAGQFSNVKCLLSDSKDILWIGSTDQGLAKYENDVITFLEGEEEGTSYSVECLAETKDGIYFGTNNGLGKVNENGKMEILDIPELENKFIRCLVWADEKILCVTRDGKLYAYDMQSCEELNLDIGDRNVRCIYHCPVRKQYMIGTDEDGIYRCNSDFEIIESIIVEDAECINAVRYTDDDDLLIATDSGVLVYSNGIVRKQQLQLDNSVDDMYLDYEGNYWFISSRKGVAKVSNSRFYNITHSANINNIVANAVLKSQDRLYIGHDEGLEIIDLLTMIPEQDPEFKMLDGIRIRDIVQDSKGQIWFCTKEHGLFCYKTDGTWKTYLSEEFEVLQSNSFRCITEMDNGKMLVGSESGAYIIDGDLVEPVIQDMDKISFRILRVFADGDKIYLGTDGYGAYEILNGEITNIYTKNQGLLSNVIMKFRKSVKSDGIWLVTGSNIAYLLEDGTIQNVENLPFTNILDMILQEDGTVWILTGGGIYKLSENALMEKNSTFEMLSRVDGTPFECTANAREYMDQDLLYLCGTEGVFTMNLANSSDKYDSYPLTIDYLHVDDDLIYIKNMDSINIPSDIKRISIQPCIPSFIPENPEVFYYLENFDRKMEKIKLKDLDEIAYTNLDGKQYIFHFGILDDETEEVIKEMTFTINKEKTLLEYPLTKVSIAIAFLLCVLLVIVIYEKNKEKKLKKELEIFYEQQEKEQLSKMAYRDYLTGLYNRNYISKWKEKQQTPDQYPISMIMIDCNNLKIINDTYGHEAGDNLLITVAEYLHKYFSGWKFEILRMGGDEYMIICLNSTYDECADKMEKVLEDLKDSQINDIPISFCYGICTMDQENFDFDQCMKNADKELIQNKKIYHQKNKGITE